jgi:hypothetical protein
MLEETGSTRFWGLNKKAKLLFCPILAFWNKLYAWKWALQQPWVRFLGDWTCFYAWFLAMDTFFAGQSGHWCKRTFGFGVFFFFVLSLPQNVCAIEGWAKSATFLKLTVFFFFHAEKATGEGQQTEEWQAIMEFSDKVSAADESGRTEAIQALMRRLNHAKPQVQVLTVSVRGFPDWLFAEPVCRETHTDRCVQVLTSCVKNCGRSFQASLCSSREFFPEIKRIVNNVSAARSACKDATLF